MTTKTQKVTVAALLIVDNKVLIVRRSSKEKFLPGYYELPGGKIDFGEDPKQGVEREFFEEVNLKVKAVRPYRVFTYITQGGNLQTVEIVYLVELNDNIKNIKLSKAHDDHQWVSEKDFERFKISDEIRLNIVEGFKVGKDLID